MEIKYSEKSRGYFQWFRMKIVCSVHSNPIRIWKPCDRIWHHYGNIILNIFHMKNMGTRTCAIWIPTKIKTTYVASLLCGKTSRFTINKSCRRKEVGWEKIDDSHRGGPRLSRKEITSKIDSILNKHGRFFKGRWKISANRKGTHNMMGIESRK